MHGPKAKNNKAPDCALTKEAIEACKACGSTKCPPEEDEAPQLAPAAGEAAEDEEMAEGEEAEGEEADDEEEGEMDVDE